MSYVGAVIGTIFGMLVSGALHKLLPDRDLTFVLAAIVAMGCIAGIVIEWSSTFGKKQD